MNPSAVGRWHISENKTFADGIPNPNGCNDGDERTHYLFSC
jgi:hypothetical protein